MIDNRPAVFVGIDTHASTHHVAVLDSRGRELADRAFAVNAAGYQEVVGFINGLGQPARIAVEGTASYGAGLTRVLVAVGWPVVETTPQDRAERRRVGKTDRNDAIMAARAALSGRAQAIPKDTTGITEAIRVLHVLRRGIVRQQTQTMNQIRQLLITAPTDVRDMVPVGTQLQLARALQQITATADSSRITAILIPALAAAAARWIALRTEAQHLQHQLTELLHHAAPRLMALDGIGSDTAARILIAIGDNRTRIKSEAALAHLFGIAPIPASSGRSTRHRLDRGGNRQGNAAIHRIALVRLAHRQDTREYITRCTARGKTHREAIRLLKRHLVREIYRNL